MRLAIINDYQNIASDSADWRQLSPKVQIDIYHDRLVDPVLAAERLLPYEIIITAREELKFNKELIDNLPNLRCLITHGMNNMALDMTALAAKGISVCGTGYGPTEATTAETTWALILALAKHVVKEDAVIRSGGWGSVMPLSLTGRTLGIVGLGKIGLRVARTALSFDMNVIAWSQNLQEDVCAEVGVEKVEKEALFQRSDFVSIHLKLSDRTRGIVDRRAIGLMKHNSCIVNTSRGQVIVEADLIDALERGSIGGAGLDVYDTEPLPQDHKFRQLPNTILLPHIGGRTELNLSMRYRDAFENVVKWLAGKPIRLLGV